MAGPDDRAVVPHPAAALPASLRLHYAAVLVTLVHADGGADEREIALVARLCDALDLDDHARGTVYEIMGRAHPRQVQRALQLLGAIGDLRFSLMADAITFCFVDGRLASSEGAALARFSDLLGVTREEALLLSRWVETQLRSEGDAKRPLTSALAAHLPATMTQDPEAAAAAVTWLERVLRR